MEEPNSPPRTLIGSLNSRWSLKTITPVRCRVCPPDTTYSSGLWTSRGALGARSKFGKTPSLFRYGRPASPPCWCLITHISLNVAARIITLILMPGNMFGDTRTIRGKRDQTLRGLVHQLCQLMSPDAVTSSIRIRVRGLSPKKNFLALEPCKRQ